MSANASFLCLHFWSIRGAQMANLSIRGVDDLALERLKTAARRQGQSLSAYLIGPINLPCRGRTKTDLGVHRPAREPTMHTAIVHVHIKPEAVDGFIAATRANQGFLAQNVKDPH
jgi:hypothetical protein